MPFPSTMNALVLSGDGYAATRTGGGISDLAPFLSYGTLPVPAPGPGEVLVKVRIASVNPSDLFFIKGEYGQPRRKGAAAGFEGVGDVVAGNGLLARTLRGRRVAFAGAAAGSGAWADYVAAKASTCVPVKKPMRDEDAAGLIVNPVTAWTMVGMAERAGAKALVLTAANSQLGKLAISLARDRGVRPIAVVRRAVLAEALLALGAAHVLIAGAEDFASRLKEVCAAEKPTFLIDAVADPVSAQIFAAMPSNTRWVIYGRMGANAPEIAEPGQLIFMRKRIEGYWLVDWFRTASFFEKMRVIRGVQKRFVSGRWRTQVSATIPLAEAMDRLLPALAAGEGKVMLVP
jgi:NADPH:quinone reductase and related Zn-dependent oxidoreductases